MGFGERKGTINNFVFYFVNIEVLHAEMKCVQKMTKTVNKASKNF